MQRSRQSLVRAEKIASMKFLSARSFVTETVFSHLKLETEETENTELNLYFSKEKRFSVFVDVQFLFASF